MLNFGNKEFRNLQEQVLKNARDIATLQGIENLKIVIVEELPEEGNPNYIYLVPNEEGEDPDIYEEYIWLADEERYEKIGGVSIDLSNFVTLDTDQTISGTKTFSAVGDITPKDNITQDLGSGTNIWRNLYVANIYNANLQSCKNIVAYSDNAWDIGSSSKRFKDLYLSGNIDFGNGATIKKDASNRIALAYNETDVLKIGASGGYTYIVSNFTPENNNTYDLGRSTYCWKNIYIAGNISDGINSVTVANISSKVTSAYASGTFDTNGEDTIDISGGSPEGLFIFAYGNCQCFVHLTATMVQNADVTPIRVTCPMMYNSLATSGWLEISRLGTTLTITVVNDAQDHVDSGYDWTLTKTNLI